MQPLMTLFCVIFLALISNYRTIILAIFDLKKFEKRNVFNFFSKNIFPISFQSKLSKIWKNWKSSLKFLTQSSNYFFVVIRKLIFFALRGQKLTRIIKASFQIAALGWPNHVHRESPIFFIFSQKSLWLICCCYVCWGCKQLESSTFELKNSLVQICQNEKIMIAFF